MIIKPNIPNHARPTGTQSVGNESAAKSAAAQKYSQVASQGAASGAEKVAVSEVGKSMHAAIAVIRETPDVRAEKVDRLKKEVESGTYQVNSRKVADKIIQEFLPVQR